MVKKLIEFFVKNIVDKPELVTIVQIDVSGKQILEIRVASQDLPKVIGKDGRTFKALRALLGTVYAEGIKDIVVDVIA